MKRIRVLIMIFMLHNIMQSYAVFDPRDTRQITIDIDADLTSCCTTFQNSFIGTFSVLESIEVLIGCSPTLITQATVGLTGFVISNSGVYQLAQNIGFSPAAPASAITVNADNVILDLSCYSIEQLNLQAGVNGIQVGNHTNVTIQNGSILGMTNDGINVSAGASQIKIDSTQLSANGLHGIFFNGSSVSSIVTIQLTGLELLANGTGITYQFVQQGTISDSFIFSSLFAGIELISSFSNVIKYCTIADTNETSDAYGISAVDGGNNTFRYNLIDNTSTIATLSNNSAVGILIGSTENNDVIMNNQVSNTITTSSAQPFGIDMQYTFTALVALASIPSAAGGVTAVVNAVDWQLNGRFLATGSGDGTAGAGRISVFELIDDSLNIITSFTQNGVTSVSWSPDGSLLVASDKDAAAPTIKIYGYDGLTLTPLTNVTFGVGNFINAVDWSLNGEFIAAGLTLTANRVRFYTYSSANLLTEVASIPVGVSVTSLNWSPNSQYIALGTTTDVLVYSFDGQTPTLITSFSHGATVNSVNWSLDGRYLVMGGVVNGGIDTRVFNFTGSALTQVATFSHGAAAVRSVNWSPDGAYVALGAIPSGGVDTRVLQFTGNSLLTVANFSNGATVNAIQWSPLGNVLAIGSDPAASNIVVRILSGLQFPSGHIIRNNLITLTHGPALTAGSAGVSTGRGLVASSGSNLIIENIAFSNDVNYVFANNVFIQYTVNIDDSLPIPIANLSFPPL